MASFQAGASIAKTLIPKIGAPGTAALRVGLGALIVALVQRPWRTMPRSWRSILVYGLSLGTMNLVFYMSLRTIPLGIAVALEFTGPLAVAAFSSRRPSHFLWLGLAVVGLLFLLPINLTATRIDPVGTAFALAAGACWAVYIVLAQRATRIFDGSTGLALAAAVAWLMPLAPALSETSPGDLLAPGALAVGLAVAVLSSVIPYSLESESLRRMPANVFGVLMSLEPAVAALAGFVVLGQRLSARDVVAIALVIAASIGVTRTATPPVVDA